MATFDIRSDKTALIVVDMSNDFVAEGAPYESADGRAMVARIRSLIEACREVGMPVIFTTQVHRRDGSDLGAVRDLHPLTRDGHALKEGTPGVEIFQQVGMSEGDYLIIKRRYSAFYGTDLEILLRNKGIDTLIIAGVATNICCESTARDAFFRDYKVIFLTDGTATTDMPDAGWGIIPAADVQRHVLTTIAFGFGEVASTADVLKRVRKARRADGSELPSADAVKGESAEIQRAV